MRRVVRINEDLTIVATRDGQETTLKLAGIEITNRQAAQELLRWTISGAWIMVEPAANDAVFLYRSPDALFLNRELVARGYARATMPGVEQPSHVTVTYLGEVNPPDTRAAAGRSSGRRTSRRSSASPAKPSGSAGARGAARPGRAGRGY